MSGVSDTLGDEIKEYESINSSRASIIGQPVVVRVDGASFSKFLSDANKPFDERISNAMIYSAKKVVEELNCNLAYTQSDEISFLFYDAEKELPFSGRFEKISSRIASIVSVNFFHQALENFPELIKRNLPSFDGRATPYPSRDLAAKSILWREIDARRNSINMVARNVFGASKLDGKSSYDKKKMLLEKGINFEDFPETFKRGSFVRRMSVLRELTPEETLKIPEKYRITGKVKRSSIEEVLLPNLVLIDNLADVLFDGADPIVIERKFALAVTG